MGSSKIVRQPAAGLAEDLQMVNDPRLNQLLFVERAPAALRIFFDRPDRFEHVSQA
jgi:hypothetical protein